MVVGLKVLPLLISDAMVFHVMNFHSIFLCMVVLFQLNVKHKSPSFLMQKCISSYGFFKQETHALFLDWQRAFSKIPQIFGEYVV
jgi:hypothetical protein